MRAIIRALLIYDIMCQWWKNFRRRVEHSPYLSVPEGLTLLRGIGDFHVRGHVAECFPRYALVFMEGIGIVDGEIVETLWSVLNETSRSSRGATLAHRSEILDDHMNHSNWKKLIGMGNHYYIKLPNPSNLPSVSTLVRKLKRARELLASSEESYHKLTASADPNDIVRWKRDAADAQARRDEDVHAMDYFGLTLGKGISVIQVS